MFALHYFLASVFTRPLPPPRVSSVHSLAWNRGPRARTLCRRQGWQRAAARTSIGCPKPTTWPIASFAAPSTTCRTWPASASCPPSWRMACACGFSGRSRRTTSISRGGVVRSAPCSCVCVQLSVDPARPLQMPTYNSVD